MADEQGYSFSEDSTRRIGEAVRRVEEMPRNTVPQSASRGGSGPNVQTVRVTSTTTTAGRYPGKLNIYDAVAKTYTESIDVWVVPTDPTGALIAGYYDARAVGEANSRMVFKTTLLASTTTLDVIDEVCAIYADSITANVNGGTW